ncbi:MAG: hypothetical protein HKUEN01_11970 [Candidatus Kuenenia stuttgartiensis]|nr:MAG: hypothetical protein HKUEN01_11970 [Candidatus Kuenenia stuttgartiensis]
MCLIGIFPHKAATGSANINDMMHKKKITLFFDEHSETIGEIDEVFNFMLR